MLPDRIPADRNAPQRMLNSGKWHGSEEATVVVARVKNICYIFDRYVD